MKKVTLMSLLALVISGAAFADPPKQRFPVIVLLVGDDGLTQSLRSFLQEGLRKYPTLRLAGTSGEARLTISSKSNVGWDNLGGRDVLIYTVFVSPALIANEPITGICYQNRLSKCVNDILRIASLRSGKP